MIPLNKHESIVAIVLGITLCILVALFGFVVNFSSGGGIHGGEVYNGGPRGAPYIYNQSIVELSMGYIPPPKTVTAYCTYTLTDSRGHVVDSSLVLHFPFSDEYIITKTLSLANDNYTFVISAHYLNGTIYTPTNCTIKVDTNVLQPEMTLLSPQHQNYAADQVAIVYWVYSPVEWSYYKLDSQEWVRFYGNTTLAGLADGPHQLQVSVKTEANEYSYNANMERTVNFYVNSTG
jgi:hypothetical protein